MGEMTGTKLVYAHLQLYTNSKKVKVKKVSCQLLEDGILLMILCRRLSMLGKKSRADIYWFRK